MDQNNNFISEDSIFNLHINKEIWNDVAEYKDEYALVLQSRELYRITFLHRAPQIHYRDLLIKHLKEIAVTLQLTHCTLHLAVYMLDIYMDNHSVSLDRIVLLANCCILIAAKVEENNLKTPKIVELNTFGPMKYTVQDYKILEVNILKFFDWSVMFPTAAHYVHYFLLAAVTKEDLATKGQNTAMIVREMNSTIQTYLDKILDDVHYMQRCKPSILSASVISIAREKEHLSEWHNKLEIYTKYSIEDIEETKQLLLQTLPLQCTDCNINLTDEA